MKYSAGLFHEKSLNPASSSKLTPDYIQREIRPLLRSLLGLQSSNFMSCTTVEKLDQCLNNWLGPDSWSCPPLLLMNEELKIYFAETSIPGSIAYKRKIEFIQAAVHFGERNIQY